MKRVLEKLTFFSQESNKLIRVWVMDRKWAIAKCAAEVEGKYWMCNFSGGGYGGGGGGGGAGQYNNFAVPPPNYQQMPNKTGNYNEPPPNYNKPGGGKYYSEIQSK